MKNDTDCLTCIEERKRRNKPLRKLHILPPEITEDPAFEKQDLPIRLCEWCDGDALPNALAAHEKR